MPGLRILFVAGGAVASVLAAVPVGAVVAPEKGSPLAAREFRHPRLQVELGLQRVEELPPADRGALLDALAELRVASPGAYVDRRTGRFATLIPVHPLLPGTGEGNRIAWDDLSVPPPLDARGWEVAGWNALVAYVRAHGAALRIDASELASPGLVTVHDGGALVQILARRVFGGVPVRDSHLTAVVSHGNLVLMGAHNWGTIRLDSRPSIGAEPAEQVLARFLAAAAPAGARRAPHLAIVPMATGPVEGLARLDRGLTYRLVWVLSPRFAGDLGTWEALVDAHSGELIAFTDTNQYQSVRRVQGGVYPVSNDQAPPDGIEQPGWPFPFADVATSGGSVFTDTGGNLPACAAGTITSTLAGRHVRINDNCGAINHSSAGDLDFGVSAGTDCVTPGFGGAGNTHAARTGFFELNKIIEQARGQLPGNAWLQQALTANTNVNLSCGALWNGTTVNLFRSGSGCANTGEIAGVFDHEWGHGMDDNDANPTISNPGEAIADVYMALRLKQSCVGRGVRPGFNCGGYGNPCLACTGVRDIDWDRRALHQPTTVTWIDANCGAGGSAPCGGGVHCESAVYSEVVWDLFARDLPALAGMSPDTALEVATRTTTWARGWWAPRSRARRARAAAPPRRRTSTSWPSTTTTAASSTARRTWAPSSPPSTATGSRVPPRPWPRPAARMLRAPHPSSPGSRRTRAPGSRGPPCRARSSTACIGPKACSAATSGRSCSARPTPPPGAIPACRTAASTPTRWRRSASPAPARGR
jgi:hypothetical protein